ncbi:helix-turn-helix domain-containing protein [Chitinophaga rhizophila]|uniref:AraC family transcriptional regulator n=1 Tax=Chitinophaga rhizophila TaxID=2866212 RepID=A0ABS7GDC7_9BACT|nr:AraC family transcriptional regulator [Chitinophaga rhizophila]MBW8685683.1 AraC family transcriptional regulator [Chitinophaga rhizophila]
MTQAATIPSSDNGSVSILRYRTGQPAARARIVLQQNLFTFLLSGEKTVHFAGEWVSVLPNQFVMLTAGNCLMTEKVVSPEADYHSILLFFDSSFLNDFFNRHIHLFSRQPDPVSARPYLLLKKDAFLETFVRSLDSMLVGDEPVFNDLQRLKLEELLLYLAAKFPDKLQEIRNTSIQANDELLVRQVVSSHLNSRVTVEELAFLCNMSLSTFKRRFAVIYGKSPNKWLLEKRLEQAVKMLIQSDRKASEIYYELGYENLSSFIQSFKRQYGLTPKQYQLSRLDV